WRYHFMMPWGLVSQRSCALRMTNGLSARSARCRSLSAISCAYTVGPDSVVMFKLSRCGPLPLAAASSDVPFGSTRDISDLLLRGSLIEKGSRRFSLPPQITAEMIPTSVSNTLQEPVGRKVLSQTDWLLQG